MPVNAAVAERYEALDAKPEELTWEGIDAFAAELEREYGGESLEYAHALSLYARLARWKGIELERGRTAIDRALAIVGEDLRQANQVWWRLLQSRLCHALNDGEAALRSAREMLARVLRGGYSAEDQAFYQAHVIAIEGWTAPAQRTLEQLRPLWVPMGATNRGSIRSTLNHLAIHRSTFSDEERAAFAAIDASETALDTARAKFKPQADPEALKAALAELDDLVGLHAVKAQVRRLVAQLRIGEQRRAAGLPIPDASHHMAFLGPPGTGKTTVARLMGRIFKALGILRTDNLIETDRAGLVAPYVGQTAPRVHAKVDEAMDGVLFIDEAYSLAQEYRNDFGHEAIAALLKRMEDDRDRLLVILAGYDEEMQKMIDSNPGLRSRIPTQLSFRAYSAGELHAILRSMFRHQGYDLTPEAEARAESLCDMVRAASDAKSFGNAREVRNIVEDTIAAQAVRLARRLDDGESLPTEALRLIIASDVTWVELGDPSLDRLDPEIAERVAVHEAGHALVRRVCGASCPVLVTIVPTPGALGRTFFRANDGGMFYRRDLIALAASALGGRAAEEEVFGEVSAGAMGDLVAAETILRNALAAGLSESASDRALQEYVLSGAGRGEDSQAGRSEIAEMLDEAWKIAREAVRAHRAQLDALTENLILHRTLQGEALVALLPPAPALPRLRPNTRV